MAKQLIGALVVVAALLVAYIFFTKGEPEKVPGANWTLPELQNFDRIEIVRAGQTMAIDKGSAGWRIQEPLAFAASQDQMEQVESLFADRDERLLVDNEKEASEANLERYGLAGEGIVEVTLFDGGREITRFSVGDIEEAQSGAVRTWIRPDGSAAIYRVNRDLRRVLDLDLTEWRNTDILVLSEEQQDTLAAVAIDWPEGGHIRLERTDEQWQMTEPEGFNADRGLITRYINNVDTLRAADFADGVDATGAGLVEPQHTVTVTLGEGESHAIKFGQEFTYQPSAEGTAPPEVGGPEQRRYVQLDDGPIYQVRASTANPFMWRTGDFRPRDVLTLQRDQVVRIAAMDRDGTEMVLVRNEMPADAEEGAEATWRMEAPEALDPVSTNELRRLLTNVSSVEALRFSDGLTPEEAGLSTPRRVITVTLADQTQHVIAIGNPTTEPTEGQSESELDHHVRVDDGDIFQLRAYKVSNLLKTPADFRPAEPSEP